MKVKVKIIKGMTNVRVLAKHPMENGRRKDDETGELIPEKFIQELNCIHKDKEVFVAFLSQSVSKNPYLAFSFNGGKQGGELVLKWLDNTGESFTTKAVIP